MLVKVNLFVCLFVYLFAHTPFCAKSEKWQWLEKTPSRNRRTFVCWRAKWPGTLSLPKRENEVMLKCRGCHAPDSNGEGWGLQIASLRWTAPMAVLPARQLPRRCQLKIGPDICTAVPRLCTTHWIALWDLHTDEFQMRQFVFLIMSAETWQCHRATHCFKQLTALETLPPEKLLC